VFPGTYTVVVLARRVDVETLVDEATRFPGGELVYANLPPDTINRLERAMGDVGADVGEPLPPPPPPA
jgi:hypothetical protein